MTRYIVVKLQFEGIHQWHGAEGDVEFLKHPHRHIFHVKAIKEVSHNDRDIEFITLKREIQTCISQNYDDLRSWSCEDIAEDLINRFDLDSCSVLEDGENGAILIK